MIVVGVTDKADKTPIMNSRQTETITRVDVRIPNHIYEQIAAIATRHFQAKVHHRSGKPEVSSTILELIKIGIAHLESSLPDSADISDKSVASELREQIQGLDARLKALEGKKGDLAIAVDCSEIRSIDTNDTVDESIQGVSRATLAPIFEEVDTGSDERGLTDQELGEVLGVSNLILRDYRVKGKKPPAGLMRKLKEWDVRGEGWVKKG
jgi:hypothetical protein